ncbi:MAG: hypothetical protein AMXMBFR33_63710 [Candidatus Xenobia bacterium]
MKLFGERRRKRPSRLEIIPMIDVMFLLLVFYILSTAALVHQQAIPVDLPGANTGEAGKEVPEVTVTVTRAGEIYLNKDRVAPGGLAQAVQQMARTHPEGMRGLQEHGVILNADMQVMHKQVVEVMDTLRGLGIVRFAIATDSHGTTP